MTRTSELPRALAAWAIIAGLGVPGCAAQEPTFDGTYSVAYAGGAVTLAIRTLPSGAVRGYLEGADARFELEGTLTTDDDGEASIEGTLSGSGLRSDFTFFEEEDGSYGLLIVPYDPAGTPRADRATVYTAARVPEHGPAPDAMPGAGPPTAAGTEPPASATDAAGDTRDARLVGIWSAQVIMNSAAGSIATEMRMQLRADGVMLELGSRALGDVGGSLGTGFQEGGEQAAWRTEGDVLWISYAGSQWVPFARFERSGDRLLLTYLHDGSRQLWSRVAGG